MKFVLLINLKLPITANSFLLNIGEHENFSANKYENANFVGIFIFIGRENFMLSSVAHELFYRGPAHSPGMFGVFTFKCRRKAYLGLCCTDAS